MVILNGQTLGKIKSRYPHSGSISIIQKFRILDFSPTRMRKPLPLQDGFGKLRDFMDVSGKTAGTPEYEYLRSGQNGDRSVVSHYPRILSWTGRSVRLRWCRARRNDAE